MSAYKAIYEEGLALQEKASYENALACYYKVAAEDEVFPALYNNMAICMKATGQTRQALAIMAKAARLLPDRPEIILNYARLLTEAENWAELEHLLTPLIEAGDEHPEALFLMAKLHFANKNYPLAYEAVSKAHAKDPEALHSIILLTTCLYELDREEEALQYLDLLLSKTIEDEVVNVLLIGLLNSMRRYDDLADYYHKVGFDQHVNSEAQFFYGQSRYAVEDYKKAVEIFTDLLAHDPECFNAYRGLGVVKMAEKEYQEAEQYFKKAYELKPDCPEVINNYALALLQLDKLEEAEELHIKAIEYDPTRPEPWVNLGSLYNYQRRYTESVAANMKAIEVRPSYLAGMTNLIGTLREMGESEKALEWLDILFEKSPDNMAGITNQAFLYLTTGRIAEGWKGYENRKHIPEQYPLLAADLPAGVSFWEGQDLTDRRIFISSEQGIGDEIMFSSCFPEIIDRAAYTVIECENRLLPLFQRSFPKAHFIARQFKKDKSGKKMKRSLEQLKPHFPLHYAVAAGTLPRYLRTKLEDFPDRESYLKADPAYVEAWGKRMKDYDGKLKVGLCWRSGNHGYQRRKYYLDLDLLRPLFQIPDIQVFNLQYGDAIEEIKASGQDIISFEGLNLKDDFDHVAALMTHLDVVVTAATSMGELAGALGKRVIRFEGGPDWTRLGAPERPWYAHMTSLRRIGENEWEPLVERLVELVSKMSPS